jgi:NADH dehydrogenase
VIWAAGVTADPLGRGLGLEADRAGRIVVGPDLAAPQHPDVFVVGDAAAATSADGGSVPGLAPAAKQMGRYAARVIAARARDAPAPPPFRYRHQGDLATIGRDAAIVKLGRLELTGFLGWLFWSVAHIYFLIGARNRIAVAFNWSWDYVTRRRDVRLITGYADPNRKLDGVGATAHARPQGAQLTSPQRESAAAGGPDALGEG